MGTAAESTFSRVKAARVTRSEQRVRGLSSLERLEEGFRPHRFWCGKPPCGPRRLEANLPVPLEAHDLGDTLFEGG